MSNIWETKSDLLYVQIALGLGLGQSIWWCNSREARLLKFAESLDSVEKMMCAQFQVSSYPFCVQYMGNKSDLLYFQIALGRLGLTTKWGICRKARLLKFAESLEIVEKMMCANF